MERIKAYFLKFKHRENLAPLLFAIAYTAIFFIDSNFFHDRLLLVLWVVIGVILTILISLIFVIAGFTVLRSLFLLSAELSLLIYLAQTYCAVPGHNADGSLQTLVGISILYISFEFFKSLKDALKKRLAQIPEKKWSKEKVMVVMLFSVFTLGFVWMIYQVVNPIILNLCIYKV